MKLIIITFISLLLFCNTTIAEDYTIIDNTVFFEDSNIYLSATPHTLSSSEWVYFNLTSKVYTGDIDAVWGFNTSVTKPTKAELYSPHWINTTSNHEKIFYNPTFYPYAGDNLDYGNSYNINYTYTIIEEIVGDNGTTYITSNASFDSYINDGINYTIFWHSRHDNYYLWKDFTSSFNSVIYDYEGFNKWYYIKNVSVNANVNYMVRGWVDIPVSTEIQKGKYYFAVKPSHETISEAVSNGHFYNLDPWWNATWSTQEEIILTGNTSGAQTDYQLLLNVTYDSDMQSDFDDLRFCNETHKIDSWLESKVDSSYALVWVEFPTTPANGINQTYYMYYGNAGAADGWDGTATFAQYYAGGSIGSSTNLYPDNSLSFAINDYAMRTRSKTSNINGDRARLCIIASDSTTPYTLPYSSITVVAGTFETQPDYSLYATLPDTNYHTFDIYGSTSSLNNSIDDNETEIQTTNIPTTFYMAYRVDGGATPDVTLTILWGVVRKYVVNPPTYTFADEDYYTGSIYYNNTNPYNHTIDSNGAISVNRTIIAVDNIGWTTAALTDDCHLVVTKYDLSNIIIANFTLYTSSLDWLTVSGLTGYTYYNLSFNNGTLIESQITDNTGIVYFTTNLGVGLYIIEKGEIRHPFLSAAFHFYDEMESGLTDFKDDMGRYLVWGIIFFAIGLAFTLFTKIKQTLIGGK